MLELFTQTAKIFTRVFTPDLAGGEEIDYEESPPLWHIRITPLSSGYTENAPSREYKKKIRIVGENRDDISICDRIEFDDLTWEIVSLVKVAGVGSIPDYLRAEAEFVE